MLCPDVLCFGNFTTSYRRMRQLGVLLCMGLQFWCGRLPPAAAQSVPQSIETVPDANQAANLTSRLNAQQQKLDEILQELRHVRALLDKELAQHADSGVAPRPPGRIGLSVGHDWYVMGSTSAPITLVEFTDLQCPFCQQFENRTFPRLKTAYIDTGKVKFVSIDLPLSMHSYAQQAAEAVQCAGDQGKFWELRAALFHRLDPPTKGAVLESAQSLGVDLRQLQLCLDVGKYRDKVEAAVRDAAALHIHGTPTFAIGRVVDGKLVGVELQGALDYPSFQTEIDKQLDEPRNTRAASTSHPRAGKWIR